MDLERRAIIKYLIQRDEIGLHSPRTYAAFSEEINTFASLKDWIHEFKADGRILTDECRLQECIKLPSSLDIALSDFFPFD
jgi:hypothetical protein